MPRPDTMLTALLRVYAVAESLERGEENPVEAAQDIQTIVLRGIGNEHMAEPQHLDGWRWRESETARAAVKRED